MQTISVFINTPTAPSVDHAIDLIRENTTIKLQLIQLEPSLFNQILDNRPCVMLLSIKDHKTRHHVRELLDHLKIYKEKNGAPERDPSCRMVLLSDEEGFGTQGWLGLGIHEFIMGPVLPRPLVFKLERHYLKALSSEVPKQTESGFGEVAVAAGMANTTAVTKVAGEVFLRGILKDKNVVHSIKAEILDNQAVVVSDKNTDRSRSLQTKFVVTASHPHFRPENGSWRNVDGQVGHAKENTWQWEPREGHMPEAKKDLGRVEKVPLTDLRKTTEKGALFHGEEPVFDSEKQAWIFSGGEIELAFIAAKPEGAKNEATTTTAFKATGHCELTSSKDSDFKIEEAKVLFLEPAGAAATDNQEPSQQQEENYLQSLIRKLEGKEPVRSEKEKPPQLASQKKHQGLSGITNPASPTNIKHSDLAPSKQGQSPLPSAAPKAATTGATTASLHKEKSPEKNSNEVSPSSQKTPSLNTTKPEVQTQGPRQNLEKSDESALKDLLKQIRESSQAQESNKKASITKPLKAPARTEAKAQTSTPLPNPESAKPPKETDVSATARPLQQQGQVLPQDVANQIMQSQKTSQSKLDRSPESIKMVDSLRSRSTATSQNGYDHKIQNAAEDPKAAWSVQDFEEQLKRIRRKNIDVDAPLEEQSTNHNQGNNTQKTSLPAENTISSMSQGQNQRVGFEHQKSEETKQNSLFSAIIRAVKSLFARKA